MDRFDYVRTFQDETTLSTSWIQAAFYIGLAHWADVTGNARYQRAMRAKAEENRWQLGPRHWHADDQAIAQMYLSLAKQTGNVPLKAVVDAFDRILESRPDNSLAFEDDDNDSAEGSCQHRWCWCDALFMAPPAWAMLSDLTGDPKYLTYALSEYFATTDYLYDREQHLFYRDSRFFGSRTKFGNKVFWSRGNGWVFAGLPLLLEALPPEHPGRGMLVELYREMAHALKELQLPDGYWSPSLLDVDHDPLPETSGTAFITYGLAWGVNHGILSRQEFAGTVENGWQALVRAVDRDGRLGWVQQVGNAPDEVRAGDTQLYGVGAFLLAASEMVSASSENALPAVEDLPLTEVPATGGSSNTLAFFASGDGGWVDLVKTIAGDLASQGIPVVGLSSLKYFWHSRPPDESSRALEIALHHYLAKWHKERIILIGYSRGADILPFMASRLPQSLRARIDLIALLAPSTATSFSVELPGWLSRKHADEIATQPEIEKLRGLKILCVYGADEPDSVCPQLPAELVSLDKRPGGHHFDRDYHPVAKRILDLAAP